MDKCGKKDLVPNEFGVNIKQSFYFLLSSSWLKTLRKRVAARRGHGAITPLPVLIIFTSDVFGELFLEFI